jgi:hypothetical protein
MTAYLLGVTLMLGRLALALGGAGRLRRVSEPVTDPSLLAMIARRSRAMRLRVVPAAALCREVVVPTVIGVLRPMILLPVTFATSLSPGQVEFILVHELEHIRRCDCLVNLIQRVAEAALFFHPAIWLVTRRIRIERENCCDDAVVATGCEPRAYAESLVALAEGALAARAGRCAAGLCADGGSGDLSGRVARILKVPAGKEVHRLRFRPLALMALMAIAAATIRAVGDGPPPVAPPAGTTGPWRAPVDNHPQPVESLLPTDQTHDLTAGSPMMIRHGAADTGGENLAANAGFEEDRSETRWPTRSGVWSGNRSTMVPAEREIQPRGGQRMLRFDMTSWGVPGECPNSQVSQIIDLSGYRDAVRAGKVRVVASAWFNRVTGGPATDRGMQISLFCFQGEHAHNFDNYEHGRHLTVASARVDTDSDVSTWERATTEARVPAAADYVLVDLVAIENVRNDLTGPEFDGHYADDVSVRVLIDE